MSELVALETQAPKAGYAVDDTRERRSQAAVGKRPLPGSRQAGRQGASSPAATAASARPWPSRSQGRRRGDRLLLVDDDAQAVAERIRDRTARSRVQGRRRRRGSAAIWSRIAADGVASTCS
ncbi:MAG: hypothetical protein ACLR3C_01375 [Eggerthella lenta]